MAEKRVSVRMSASGGREVRAELEGLGESGQRSLKGISTEAEVASAKLEAFGRRAAVAAAAMAGALVAAAAAMVRSGLQTVDAQAKLARSLDTTVESVQVLERAGRLAGVSMGQVEQATVQLTRRLSQAAGGTGPAVAALDRLGLSAEALAALPLDERLVAIQEALEANVPAAEQAAVAARLFGDRAALAFARIDSATLRTATADVRDFGVAVSEQDAAQIERTNDALSRLGLIWQGVANQLTAAVAPALERIADGLAAVTRQGTPFATAVQAVVSNLDRLVVVAGTFAALIAGRYVAAMALAVARTLALAGALTTLRLAIARTGFGLLAIGVGELVYQLMKVRDPLESVRDVLDEIADKTDAARIETGNLNAVVQTAGTVSLDYARSLLAQAEAQEGVMRAARAARIDAVQGSEEYQKLFREANRAQRELLEAEQRLRIWEAQGDAGFLQAAETRQQIEGWQQALDRAVAAMGEMIAVTRQETDGLREIRSIIDQVRTAIDNATQGVVQLSAGAGRVPEPLRQSAINAAELQRIIHSSSMGGLIGQAEALAQRLGVSVRHALLLREGLAAVAAAEAAVAAGGLSFGAGLGGSPEGFRTAGSAMLGFGNLAQRVRRQVEDLSASLGGGGGGRGGGGGGGGGLDEAAQRAAEWVERVRSATEWYAMTLESLNAALASGAMGQDFYNQVVEALQPMLEAGDEAARRMAEQVMELNELFVAGALDAETYRRAIEMLAAELEGGAQGALTGWAAVTDRVARFAAELADWGKSVGDTIVSMFGHVENAIVQAVQTGKLDWRAMINAMIADLARLVTRMLILEPLARGLSGWLGKLGVGGASAASAGAMAGAGAMAAGGGSGIGAASGGGAERMDGGIFRAPEPARGIADALAGLQERWAAMWDGASASLRRLMEAVAQAFGGLDEMLGRRAGELAGVARELSGAGPALPPRPVARPGVERMDGGIFRAPEPARGIADALAGLQERWAAMWDGASASLRRLMEAVAQAFGGLDEMLGRRTEALAGIARELAAAEERPALAWAAVSREWARTARQAQALVQAPQRIGAAPRADGPAGEPARDVRLLLSVAPTPEFDVRLEEVSTGAAVQVVREYDRQLPARVRGVWSDPRKRN